MAMYVNIDSDSAVDPFLNRIVQGGNITEQMLYPFVDQYKDTCVTDLVFNNFCQSSSTLSNVWEDFRAKYNKEYENGIKVNYKDINAYKAKIKLLDEYGIDFFEVWINRSRELGFRTWLSVRMNDYHYHYEPTTPLRDDFFYEAQKNGWMIGDKYEVKSCYDYKCEPVRKRMLDYIEEQLLTYNADGIELDFMREIYCFKYLDEGMDVCTEIMNGFMREVRAITKKAEQKWNHEVKIMVRLARNVCDNLTFGFDASKWISDGSADIIVPSPRWISSDSGIDIKNWKAFTKGGEVVACIECLVDCRGTTPCSVSPEIARGLSASYLSQGSDGIYLYNLFSDPDEENADDVNSVFHSYKRNHAVYNTCGDFDLIYKNPIRFAVIPQRDVYWGISDFWKPLPVEIGEAELEIITGKIPSGKKAMLIIGISTNNTEVVFNGKPLMGGKPVDIANIDGIGKQPEEYKYDDALYMCYELDYDCLNAYRQNIKLKCSDKATAYWVEIAVI